MNAKATESCGDEQRSPVFSLRQSQGTPEPLAIPERFSSGFTDAYIPSRDSGFADRNRQFCEGRFESWVKLLVDPAL